MENKEVILNMAVETYKEAHKDNGEARQSKLDVFIGMMMVINVLGWEEDLKEAFKK